LPGHQDEPVERARAEDGWRKQRLFEALRWLLAALPQVQPVAVVVEDVHWADASTLEVLDYLLTPSSARGRADRVDLSERRGDQPRDV
jgi:predicted ATPase